MNRSLLVFVACVLAMLTFGGAAIVSAQTQGKDGGSVSVDNGVYEATDGSCPMNFSDVPPGSTYYEYVQCLFCRGIINGYPDNTFRPNNNVTRGQLSKIVSESAGLTVPPGPQLFEDVLPGSTYYTPVQRLVQFGYINGYNCGGVGEPCSPQGYRYFRPNAPASRGQIAKVVTLAAGWSEPTGAQVFQDVPGGSTFFDYIQRLYNRNAVSGYPCGGPGEPCVAPVNRPYFRPTNNVTRGQISRIDVIAFFSSCVTKDKQD